MRLIADESDSEDAALPQSELIPVLTKKQRTGRYEWLYIFEWLPVKRLLCAQRVVKPLLLGLN